VTATIAHLPLPDPSPDSIPAFVADNWDDKTVRQIWESLSDRPAKLALIRTWLEIRDPYALVARSNLKTGLPGIWEYWTTGCWKSYGHFGWTRVLDALDSLRARPSVSRLTASRTGTR